MDYHDRSSKSLMHNLYAQVKRLWYKQVPHILGSKGRSANALGYPVIAIVVFMQKQKHANM